MARFSQKTATDVCLSREEMRSLCGTPYREKQLEFLILNGIAHYKGLDGRPRVLWATLEGAPDASVAQARAVAEWKPNKVA
ncbi:DUF4224 domain-containing protein [Stenotrophomonas sp.]|uniref:DUF4224 domain-containing protein n=1 Tax=Stenotrophomonas sp. TaxID=69392 RepID=UPI0028A1EFE7|nr:DUF4224 domain-containing protein [Stenotrophomonas sp.]